MHTDTYRCGVGRKAYMGRRTGCTQTPTGVGLVERRTWEGGLGAYRHLQVWGW